ncbi:MAG: P-loop containing nucleoside triphosphate hydrolase protein [Olpidium bornovanus]|uniref:P-loop containing nucleoside triphosphate hydrolase protein n=1 Tax=Olpidium bornovanus TaxID=278681 RepID=A0A8H7ZX71_9FUNG|nr:MAG: P-loop containing nucleoside triphosphate hydrolase protein [Olpidium bornovanus]
MISGASQADVALLVVDATKGEFEAGFHSAGQTKEHALLVRSLGVQQLVVAVNKMDVVHTNDDAGSGFLIFFDFFLTFRVYTTQIQSQADWAHDRFEEISAQLSAFLMSVGFKKANLYFVPCSGMVGENIVSRECPKLKAWYDGPTLVDVFGKYAWLYSRFRRVRSSHPPEMFEPPVRPIQKPFRLSVTDFFKGGHSAAGSGGSVSVAGRIEAGSVQVGNAVTVVPGFASGTVKSVVVKDESAHWAVAGDSVILTLSGLELQQLSCVTKYLPAPRLLPPDVLAALTTGAILCPPGNLVPLTNHFLAQIVVFDVKVPITNGYPVRKNETENSEKKNARAVALPYSLRTRVPKKKFIRPSLNFFLFFCGCAWITGNRAPGEAERTREHQQVGGHGGQS